MTLVPRTTSPLPALSAQARSFLNLCARSRAEERPGRHKAAQTTRPKAQPIIPIAKAQGVSRGDIVERCRWWGETGWTIEVVSAVVDELVAAGILMRCVNGIRFADAWGHMMARTLGADLDRVDAALSAAAGRCQVGVRASAGMVHLRSGALALDWTPSHSTIRIDLLQELDDIAAVIAEMRAAVAEAAS